MFNLEEFVASPSVENLTSLTKTDWSHLATHYNLEPRASFNKTQLRDLVLEHLIDEERLSEVEVSTVFPSYGVDAELVKLNLERERIKLELLREQNRARTTQTDPSEKYVPTFDEEHPELFFSQFEKLAVIHQWPRERWAVLLSNVFSGEARNVYNGLTIADSLDYSKVKSAILHTYKRVPVHYQQIFRSSQKIDGQTCVEFFREKKLVNLCSG